MVVVDVFTVHQFVTAQTFNNRFDCHCRKGCPQKVKAPRKTVEEGIQAQQAHKAKGDRIRKRNKTSLQSKLIDRLVVGNFLYTFFGLWKCLGFGFAITHFQIPTLFVNVDVKNTEHRCHYKTNGSKRQAKATVSGKLCRLCVGKVNIPTECISGALTKAQRQNQAANVRNNLFPVTGNEKQKNGKSKPYKSLQHVSATLKGTELKDLRALGLVCASFCFECHSGKADCKAVVGDYLHQAVIHQNKADLLTDNVYNQQHRSAQKCGRHKTFAEKRNFTSQSIAHKQKYHQKSQLHQKAPYGAIIGK